MNFNTSELSNFRNCVSEDAGSNSPGNNSKKKNSKNSQSANKKVNHENKSPSTLKKQSILGLAPESSRKGISSQYSSKILLSR
jgi:hypothetical protein